MNIVKKVVLFCLSVLAFQVQALGLGEMNVKSSFNQPFEAHIPLIGARDITAENLKVSLASVERFKKAGVEYKNYLTTLNFAIKGNGNAAYIHVYSRELLKEPFIDFLLQVKSADGDLIQEYTALFDPPTR